MRSWIFIPHLYQPPTQSLTLTELILRSCYLPFLDLLLGNPHIEMSLNLSASLVLQLESIPNHNFFSKIHDLVQRNQIEFLSSPIFHPIVPLTPEPVTLRQIKENADVIERFCSVKPVNGFFPPELAIDQKSLELLSDSQFEFVIVDESSINPNFELNKIPENLLMTTGGRKTGLLSASDRTRRQPKLFVSSRTLTELLRSYPTELKSGALIPFIESKTEENQLIICASDAEIFGHHYTERIHLLKDLFGSPHFKFVKVSTVLNKTEGWPADQTPTIYASSWQTSAEDIKSGNPFPLWNHPGNSLQQKYQHLADLAYQALCETENVIESTANPYHIRHSAENHFDQGLSSCHYYWLSNSPWWHPDLVEEGAKNLVKTIRTLPVSPEAKRKTEEFYHRFMLDVWDYHWSGKVEENYNLHDRKRLELLKNLPFLT